MKTATLKFIGRQEGIGRIPGFDLYNVLAVSEPHEKLPIGTTTTIATVEKLGYQVVEQEEPEPNPMKVRAIVYTPQDIPEAMTLAAQGRGLGLNFTACIDDGEGEYWLICSNRELTDEQAESVLDEDGENEFPSDKPQEYDV